MLNSFKAEQINILTDRRAIQCFHKRNVSLQSSSLPYSAIHSLFRKEYSKLSFLAINPRDPGYPIQQFCFNNVSNILQVEKIIRSKMIQYGQKQQFVGQEEFSRFDFHHTEKEMYYKSLKSFLLLRNDHDNWPLPFKTLLEINLEDDIEGKETIIYSFKPSYWTLWKKTTLVFIAIAAPLMLIFLYISIALSSAIIFFLGLFILLSCFLATLFTRGLIRYAVALTTRGVIILKTGTPSIFPWVEKWNLSYSRGCNYSIKLPYDSVYPLISTLNLKTYQGSVQLLLDSHFILYFPDERPLEEILHNSYQLTQQT